MIKKGCKVRFQNGALIVDVVALDRTKITVLFGNAITVADISNLFYTKEKNKVKKEIKNVFIKLVLWF